MSSNLRSKVAPSTSRVRLAILIVTFAVMAITLLALWPVESGCDRNGSGSLDCQIGMHSMLGIALLHTPASQVLALVVLVALAAVGAVSASRLRVHSRK